MKRILPLMLMLLVFMSASVFASKPVWLDLQSDALLTAKSAVIMPMVDENGRTSTDMNQYILKKAKGVKTIGAWNTASTLGVNVAKYEAADISAALTGKADLMVVPFILNQSSEPVVSPGTYADVLLRSWEEIKDDDGTRRRHEREHYETVYIPEETIYVNQTDIDFYVYDKNGNLVMTLSDARYNHDSLEHQTKNLVDNFFDEMKDSVKLLKKYNRK